MAVTTTLTAVALGGGTWYLEHKLSQAASVDVALDSKLPGAINFLILGSDSRAFVETEADAGSFGDTGVVSGQRADAMIIARVEPRSKQGLLVSFPRDLLVRNKAGNLRRINESFTGGPQGVIDVMKANFGIPIHHYIELDFAGFRSMVDAIGGVTMYIFCVVGFLLSAWCPWPDSNGHVIADNRFRVCHVYQFRHRGTIVGTERAL